MRKYGSRKPLMVSVYARVLACMQVKVGASAHVLVMLINIVI